MGFPPGWVGEQRCEREEKGYHGIGQAEHGWAFLGKWGQASLPYLYTFSNFCGKSNLENFCTVETRKRHSPQSGSQNPCLSSTDEETTAFVTRCGQTGRRNQQIFRLVPPIKGISNPSLQTLSNRLTSCFSSLTRASALVRASYSLSRSASAHSARCSMASKSSPPGG